MKSLQSEWLLTFCQELWFSLSQWLNGRQPVSILKQLNGRKFKILSRWPFNCWSDIGNQETKQMTTLFQRPLQVSHTDVMHPHGFMTSVYKTCLRPWVWSWTNDNVSDKLNGRQSSCWLRDIKFKFKFNFISSQFKVTNIQIDIKSINLQTKIDTAICKVWPNYKFKKSILISGWTPTLVQD